MALTHPIPAPLYDDAWENFLHDVFAGVTGLDPTLVRPRWQPEPPLRPDINVDWLSFGVLSTEPDGFTPAISHHADADGYDALHEHEVVTIICSFYGPHSESYCSILRRGLFIDQNRAVFRANSVGLVDTSGVTRSADYVKERWWPRNDIEITLRREIQYHYNVLNLISAHGLIFQRPQEGGPVRVTPFDTENVSGGGGVVPIPELVTFALREDGGLALREDGGRELREDDVTVSRAEREDGGLALREDGGEELRE